MPLASTRLERSGEIADLVVRIAKVTTLEYQMDEVSAFAVIGEQLTAVGENAT